MIKTIGSYGISATEAIEMFSLSSKIAACSFEKTNTLGKVCDLPKDHNCRNCGAPVKGHKCEYCGTRY